MTIFAHQSAAVFAGQVAHAPGAPAMPAVSGVGDGAFGSTTAGRSIVNAYSTASRTLVAAQAPGALAPVEALARVALARNSTAGESAPVQDGPRPARTSSSINPMTQATPSMACSRSIRQSTTRRS